MDLRDKLKQYESHVAPKTAAPPKMQRDLVSWIDGQEIESAGGVCFQSLAIFPEDYVHGAIPLSEIFDHEAFIYQQVGRDPRLGNLDLLKTLFIDTETTGLAGGTGTVPFLIGLGYFEKSQFHVEQLFIRDYHEEQAMLHVLAERFGRFDFLVSYNGKAYDMNLIQSRFLMHRMKNPATDHPHLDLLYPVRRIWQQRLKDCSLSHIEQKILNFHRQGDIPGFMIPDIFFRYIRTGDGRELASVFEHNRWDIISLAALISVLGKVHQSPETNLKHPEDLFHHGRSLFHADALDACLSTLGSLTNCEKLSPIVEESQLLSSFCYKKLDRWHDAIQLWNQLVEKFPHRLEAYEELAKYYEHREKNLDAAIHIVQRALTRLEVMRQLRPQAEKTEPFALFSHRLQRLLRKQNQLGIPPEID